MVWLLFLDGVTLLFREMLFLQAKEGTLWSVTSFQKVFGVLCQIYHHFKCLLCKKPYDKNVVTPEKIVRVWLPLTQMFFCLPKLLTEMPED